MLKSYDFIVIGAGPAGIHAALEAAAHKKRVLLIDEQSPGGACVRTGTVPSKSLREGALHGGNWSKAQTHRRKVLRAESDGLKDRLRRSGVEFLKGHAVFSSPKELKVSGGALLSAGHFLIASGGYPLQHAEIPKHPRIFDSDTIVSCHKLPKSMLIIGAGVIGCEYASIFAASGASVTLIDRRHELLRMVDSEIVEALSRKFGENGVSMQLGAEFSFPAQKNKNAVSVVINKKTRKFGGVLICLGRGANTKTMGLEAAGVACDERGFIKVGPGSFRTGLPTISAAGDCIGAPALAATGAEQGRLAVQELYGTISPLGLFPCGIYTIPEIASVGLREDELKGRPYVTGRAWLHESTRGRLEGAPTGCLLKLLFSAEKDGKLLGAHCIGPRASELIHMGLMAIQWGAGIDYFRGQAFNYPTYAECYKRAAQDAALP